MFARLILGSLFLIALATFMLQDSKPADAAFHCMRIHAVMGGANGDTDVQYVELRMSAAGQTQVNGTVLRFFDSTGTQTGTFTLNSNLPTNPPLNSSAGSSILIATADLQTDASVTADFTMPANLMAPDGKVQFTGSFNCPFSGTVIDSVAYGTVDSGVPDCPLLAPVDAAAPALPTAGTQALTLNNLNQYCGISGNDNSTEYTVETAAPRNNAGTVGSFGGGQPGDADGDGLSDDDEINIYGTNPNDSDTDDDGLNDGVEVLNFGTDPLLPDTDDDNFNDGVEIYVITDPLDDCADTSVANDESDDKWPADFDDNQTLDIIDVLALKPVFGTDHNNPIYSNRHDLNADEQIDIIDVLAFKPIFGINCTL